MLIHHVMLIALGSANEVTPDDTLLIRQGVIADVGSSRDLLGRYPAEERLDAGGLWLLPGFICAHARMSRSLAQWHQLSLRPLHRRYAWPLCQIPGSLRVVLYRVARHCI